MVQKYQKVIRVWQSVAPLLSPPQSEKELDNLIEFADYIMEQTQGDEKHPLMGLLDIVGTLISECEHQHIPEPKGTPLGALKYLMQEHGIKRNDLAELGSAQVISDIFSGKRELNISQIKALSKRFGCSADIFV